MSVTDEEMKGIASALGGADTSGVSDQEMSDIMSSLEAEDPEGLSQLRSFEFQEKQSELAAASRKQKDETSFEYFRRQWLDSVERGAVTSLDILMPDDIVDMMRGAETRDTFNDYFIPLPSRLMTPEENTAHREYLRSILPLLSGPEPLPPTGDLTAEERAQRFVGAGVEGVADISNFAFSGGKAAINFIQSFLPSAVADTVITSTSDLIMESDLSPATKTAILVSLGVGSGISTHVSQQTMTSAYQGYKAVKTGGGKAVESGLKGEKARFANLVISSDENFHKFIDYANTIKAQLPEGQDLKIIPIAAALQNPIMRNKFIEFYGNKENSAFIKKIDDAVSEFQDYEKRIFGEMTGRFGLGEADTVASAVVRETAKRTEFEQARQLQIQKQIDIVDEKMSTLTAKIPATEGVTEIGKVGQSLVNEKISLIKKRLSPMYTQWGEEAATSGARMNADSVQSLLDYTSNLTTTEGRYLKSLPLINRFQKRTPDDEAVSAKDVKQLKEQVNNRLRDLRKSDAKGSLGADGYAEIRVLSAFKNRLHGEIRKMPMGKELLEIDKLYYKELGIPTNTSGIARISTAEYTNNITRHLLNVTNAEDFLSLVGDEGKTVIRDAIYSKIHRLSVKGNDVANEKQVNNFLSDPDNMRVIRMVDGLEQELSDTSSAISNAKSERARLKKEYRANAYQEVDDMLKLLGTGGVDPLVSRMLDSETRLPEFNNVVKYMDKQSEEIFRTAIREQLVQRAVQFRDPVLTGGSKKAPVMFMNQHRRLFEEMFGKQYIKDVENTLAAYEIVATLDLKSIAPYVNRQAGEFLGKQTGGMGLSGLSSIYRRSAGGIMSTEQAATYGGSRILQSALVAKRDLRYQDLILEPDTVAALSRQYEQMKKATTKEKFYTAAKAVAGVIASSSLKGSYIGQREARLGEEQQERIKREQE